MRDSFTRQFFDFTSRFVPKMDKNAVSSKTAAAEGQAGTASTAGDEQKRKHMLGKRKIPLLHAFQMQARQAGHGTSKRTLADLVE